MKKMTSGIIGILMLIIGCTNRDTIVDKSQLLGNDYRLFQSTPVWDLAKAVEDGDTDLIRKQVNLNKSSLNFRESRFGQTLLHLAVLNSNLKSVKVLLELGADPNIQDMDYGESPLMEAVGFEMDKMKDGTAILKYLLKYGGDPNAPENGPQKHGKQTPLIIACYTGSFDFVKILVNAGAQVNKASIYGDTPLQAALISGSPDIVLYLIKQNVEYKKVLYKTIEGEDRYITNALRDWQFDLGSEKYKKKMELVKILKENGMDYFKTPIPKQYLDEYSKDYLEKY